MKITYKPEDTGWGDIFTSKGTQKMTKQHQKLGEMQGKDSPSQPSEGTSSLDTLVLDS